MFKQLITRLASLVRPLRQPAKRDNGVLAAVAALTPPVQGKHGRSKEERSLVSLRRLRKVRMRIQRASRQRNRRVAA